MQKPAVFLDFQGTIGGETLDDIRFLISKGEFHGKRIVYYSEAKKLYDRIF